MGHAQTWKKWCLTYKWFVWIRHGLLTNELHHTIKKTCRTTTYNCHTWCNSFIRNVIHSAYMITDEWITSCRTNTCNYHTWCNSFIRNVIHLSVIWLIHMWCNSFSIHDYWRMNYFMYDKYIQLSKHVAQIHKACHRGTHIDETCHTKEWAMSHKWMSHVTQVNESCHTYEWVISHKWMSHVTQVNESCYTNEWVMSHIWMRHVI